MSGTPPTPAIPSFTTGTILTQTGLNALGANLTNLYTFLMGGFRTQKPICTVRITTTTHALPNATDTIVRWDTADINYDTMFAAVNNDRMTVNTAGVYRLYGQVAQNTSLPVMECTLCVNGTSKVTNGVGAMAAQANKVNCGATVSLAVGATIQLSTAQSSGSSLNLVPDTGGTRMSAEWISP